MQTTTTKLRHGRNVRDKKQRLIERTHRACPIGWLLAAPHRKEFYQCRGHGSHDFIFCSRNRHGGKGFILTKKVLHQAADTQGVELDRRECDIIDEDHEDTPNNH